MQADDQLFVTLDAKTRLMRTETFGKITLTDTVGFIDDLPGALLEAFASTLEEIKQADLLVHVLDASDPDKRRKTSVVDSMLKKLDASSLPVLMVYNKTDLLTSNLALVQNEFAVSVRNGTNIPELITAVLAAARDHLQE